MTETGNDALQTLAIQSEAWVQEELGAQQALLATLERLERAARRGERAELERGAGELETALARRAARETRRPALLGKLAAALGVSPAEVSLTKLVRILERERIDGRRIDRLRDELRDTVALVVRTSRRLAALARYHRTLFEELCARLEQHRTGEPGAGTLLDARG